VLRFSSSRRLEILQHLLGDGQLLHLSLPCHQSSLLVPQTGLSTIGVELTGQDLGTAVLQSFPLPVEVGLMTLEGGLTGAQDLGLATECDVVQLFLLGVGVALVDGLHLQVEAALPCPRRRPLGDCRLFEYGGPQLEAPAVVNEALVFSTQYTLHLGRGPVSRAHSLIQGNVVRRLEGGVPQDHLRSHCCIGYSAHGSSCTGCRRGRR
jgi:hypothetical protein